LFEFVKTLAHTCQVKSHGRTISLVGSITALVALSFAVAGPASAATATTTGVDISYPQCTTQPNVSTRPFGIVGVNGGKASTLNPCFASQYNSALLLTGSSEQPHAAVYLNTGDPGTIAAWWPSSNKTQAGTAVANPHGTCAHKSGSACAFVYGYSMAEADFTNVTVTNGFSTPPMWWLDVETSNTWSTTDKVANASSLTGMVTYLKSVGINSIGIYSTAYQWKKIAGATSASSVLARLQSWLAGASSTSAAGDCSTLPALTPGGRVSLVQYVSGGLDNDFSCHIFAPTPISFTGGQTLGSRLVSHHAPWIAGSVVYHYQWFRNGVAIKGATSPYRTLTKYDLGHKLTIEISGHASGYNPRVTQSVQTAVIARAFTSVATPTITGTKSVGQTLAANRGTWKPGTPVYHYRWFRSGIPVAGATGKTYALTALDGGQSITVSVTGTRKGYATATRTSLPAVIPGVPVNN
jgi:hypothetical protein